MAGTFGREKSGAFAILAIAALAALALFAPVSFSASSTSAAGVPSSIVCSTSGLASGSPLCSNFNWQTIGAFLQTYLGNFGSVFGPTSSCAATITLADMLVPSIFISVVVILFVSLMYMAGQFLQSQNIIALSKEEFFRSLESVFWVLFIIFFVMGANSAFRVVANPNDPMYSPIQDPATMKMVAPTLIDSAMRYSQFVTYQISSELGALMLFNTFLHTIYSATVYVGLTQKAMFSFNVGPILKPLVDMFGIIIQFLSTALGEWILHFSLLCFIKRWSWEMIAPFAVLLRAIPQTRGAGNALLAIIFSFTLVYPITMVSNWEMHKLTYASSMPSDSLIAQFYESSGIVGTGLIGIIFLFTVGSVVMPFLMGYVINLVFELIKDAIYYTVIVSLLMPFLNIFITLTASKEAARAFGSEINFAAFVKLI